MAISLGVYPIFRHTQTSSNQLLPPNAPPGIRFVATARRVTAVEQQSAVNAVTGSGHVFRPATRPGDAATPGFPNHQGTRFIGFDRI